jgi:hypothetical protein
VPHMTNEQLRSLAPGSIIYRAQDGEVISIRKGQAGIYEMTPAPGVPVRLAWPLARRCYLSAAEAAAVAAGQLDRMEATVQAKRDALRGWVREGIIRSPAPVERLRLTLDNPGPVRRCVCWGAMVCKVCKPDTVEFYRRLNDGA